MARRRTELGLLLLVFVIVAGAYVLTALGRTADVPADIGPFLGVVLALLLAAHLATRVFAPGANPVLLPIAALLNGLGYVMIARLDPDLAGLQATWTAVAIAAYVGTLALVTRTRDLQRYRWTFALVGLVLLLLPLVPGIGREINGSRIWVSIGPVNFQPGEFAKIALALFFAAYLVERRELLAVPLRRIGPIGIPDPRHLGPVLAAWIMSMVVMTAERDLGSSLLFFALFVVLVWVATGRAAWLAVGGALFAAGAWFAWRQFGHVQDRVDIWLDPWEDPSGRGFQLVQTIFALAWGGVTGAGLGLGDPGRIPAAETDFIFAVIGEELGLLGAAAVLAAFLLLIGTGLRTALQADPPFEKLLATGLTTILGLQAFIIIGGVIRVVPLTGVTLPFVSYGGSSLVANYVLLALLVRISDENARRAGEVPPTRRQARRATQAGAGAGAAT
ncbi:MAG: FtsW/RodA/SpoVE family cell cycle protein [Acidimicrobiales bacterium]|nr:FtsW/RodA/SpoVE family cell cycle protein [Acidimicrobiales bacterium]